MRRRRDHRYDDDGDERRFLKEKLERGLFLLFRNLLFLGQLKRPPENKMRNKNLENSFNWKVILEEFPTFSAPLLLILLLFLGMGNTHTHLTVMYYIQFTLPFVRLLLRCILYSLHHLFHSSLQFYFPHSHSPLSSYLSSLLPFFLKKKDKKADPDKKKYHSDTPILFSHRHQARSA